MAIIAVVEQYDQLGFFVGTVVPDEPVACSDDKHLDA